MRISGFKISAFLQALEPEFAFQSNLKAPAYIANEKIQAQKAASVKDPWVELAPTFGFKVKIQLGTSS